MVHVSMGSWLHRWKHLNHKGGDLLVDDISIGDWTSATIDYSAMNRATKPGGGGFFDVVLGFGSGRPQLQSTTFTVAGSRIADFVDFASATQSVGGAKGPYTFAAHIQRSNFTVPRGNGGPFAPARISWAATQSPSPHPLSCLSSAYSWSERRRGTRPADPGYL